MSTSTAPDGVRDIDLLLALFERPAAQRVYTESVTQAEHAMQCAGLAEAAQADDALIAAALLHDIGHLLTIEETEMATPPGTDRHHEAVGAAYLGRWFHSEVTRPVALHVAAKRYLCGTDARYGANLSPASVHSLQLQGGPMSRQQCNAFRSARGWVSAIELRCWDDKAKRPGATTLDFERYRPLLVGLLSRRR